MRYTYEAVFTEDKQAGGYTVNFPDLHYCFTEGDTFQEAVEMAADALSLYLGSDELGGVFSEPPTFNHPIHAGEKRVLISVDTDLSSLGVTTTQAARLLNVSVGRVQQLVARGELDSLKFGRDRLVSGKSLQKRLQNPRKAGRPKSPVHV
jgi:excisionase family DNA binding protein